MSSKEDCLIYSFWNGKNLNGTNQCFDYNLDNESCNQCDLKCVEGSETICADDL